MIIRKSNNWRDFKCFASSIIKLICFERISNIFDQVDGFINWFLFVAVIGHFWTILHSKMPSIWLRPSICGKTYHFSKNENFHSNINANSKKIRSTLLYFIPFRTSFVTGRSRGNGADKFIVKKKPIPIEVIERNEPKYHGVDLRVSIAFWQNWTRHFGCSVRIYSPVF